MEALRQFVQNFRLLSGFRTDHRAFSDVVKACASVSELTSGRVLHGCVTKLGHMACTEVSKAVLNMYAKCRRIDDCQKMFKQMNSVDPVVWNIVLTGLSDSCAHETMIFYKAMQFSGEPKPSSVTFAVVLPVCVRLGDLYNGKSMHSNIIKIGLEKDTILGNALVSMYAKFGLMFPHACTAFDSIADQDVVSWNAIIAGFSENKKIADAFKSFCLMLKEPLEPNYATIANILPVCASMDKNIAYRSGSQIHSYVVQRFWLQTHIFVCNSLVSFYLRVGSIDEAASLFMRMGSKDLVSWNVVIAGYASNCEWFKALQLFHKLVHNGNVSPDSVTIVSILPVCVQVTNLPFGKEIHSYILRHSYLLEDTSVGNALISFYARFGDTSAAYWAFSLIPKKDVISWNSILDAFAESSRHSQFINLLHHLLNEAITLDYITILSLVKFCTNVQGVCKLKEVHGYSVKAGLLHDEEEPMLGNALLDAYAKCGNVGYAHKIFQGLAKRRTLVTYNSMLSGYVNNSGSHNDAQILFSEMSTTDLTTWSLMVRIYAESGCPNEAIGVFHEIQARGMRPNTVTIMNLLPVCAQVASLQLVRQCHGYILRGKLGDIRLKGTLLDVYAKCGSLKNAYSVFDSHARRDLVMFTAMVAAYAVHGMGKEALMIYSHMIESGIKSDHVFITTLLTACCHAGLIQEGLQIFDSIGTVHGMKPTMEQYASVVDLLSRGGRLDDAYSFVTQMPVEPNANIWGTLLRACTTYRMDLGLAVANHLLQAESNDTGDHILISNMYAKDGKWEGVMEMRSLMKRKEMKKPAGCSWLEVDGQRNVFVSGDCSHPQRDSIFDSLYSLYLQMKEAVAF